jgi:hypothetical protein
VWLACWSPQNLSSCHTVWDTCVSIQEKKKTQPSAHSITSQALMRCLLCQTLRSFWDKALPWVNNEWCNPINSKFDCILCFLNMKEDRSSQGNEPLITRSQSPLSTSQLINRVKCTQQPSRFYVSFPSCPAPFACCTQCLYKGTRWACLSTLMLPPM